MQNEIREDMLKVKKMISDVEIIIGKKYGETELVNKLIDAENLLAYCMSRLENAIVPPCKVEQSDGLYGKYTVVKNSTGELVTDCFVLKPSKDETARKALLFYADNCKIPQLSDDIKEWLQELKEMRADNV